MLLTTANLVHHAPIMEHRAIKPQLIVGILMINKERNMKFKCAVVGLTLMSLAGCSHQNELAEMPTKEASLAIQLAAVSAQQELTGKKTNGSVYFDLYQSGQLHQFQQRSRQCVNHHL